MDMKHVSIAGTWTGFVYKMSGGQCNSVYIGQTGLSLERRYIEHRQPLEGGSHSRKSFTHADENAREKWRGAEDTERMQDTSFREEDMGTILRL